MERDRTVKRSPRRGRSRGAPHGQSTDAGRAATGWTAAAGDWFMTGEAMTEAEWLTCADPQRILGCLLGRAGDRKLRLFACSCCRRIWDHLPKASRKALKAVEEYADHQRGGDELNSIESVAAREVTRSEANSRTTWRR